MHTYNYRLQIQYTNVHQKLIILHALAFNKLEDTTRMNHQLPIGTQDEHYFKGMRSSK
jgi:hypothetical protein